MLDKFLLKKIMIFAKNLLNKIKLFKQELGVDRLNYYDVSVISFSYLFPKCSFIAMETQSRSGKHWLHVKPPRNRFTESNLGTWLPMTTCLGQ